MIGARPHRPFRQLVRGCGPADIGLMAAALFCSLYLFIVVVTSVLHAADLL